MNNDTPTYVSVRSESGHVWRIDFSGFERICCVTWRIAHFAHGYRGPRTRPTHHADFNGYTRQEVIEHIQERY